MTLPQTDAVTPLEDLRRLMAEFVAERDWEQFHTPKNLVMSLAIEAAELMEPFQWLTPEASLKLRDDPERLEHVGEELADVLCYAMALANQLGLDVTQAVIKKLAKNRQKYPAEQYRGRYGADDPGPASKPARS